jgi:putative PIN family toxin of toxin-antitoxin system
VGVVVSGLLSSDGPPATLLDLWRNGDFDLIVSGTWLGELERVLARPKLARHVDADSARELLAALRQHAILAEDPPPEPGLTPDPGDDYLVSLARSASAAVLVSGDTHLTGLADPDPPVLTPRAFVGLLD